MDGPNRVGIELEDIAEAMSQLANIGSELLRPEDDRDPLWRSIPVAKEIMVTKGIASRAPWEAIQVFIDPFMYQVHYIFWSLGFGLRSYQGPIFYVYVFQSAFVFALKLHSLTIEIS